MKKILLILGCLLIGVSAIAARPKICETKEEECNTCARFCGTDLWFCTDKYCPYSENPNTLELDDYPFQTT